jgi:hypothetical protein
MKTACQKACPQESAASCEGRFLMVGGRMMAGGTSTGANPEVGMALNPTTATLVCNE